MALALVAKAFVGKKPHLIKDADNLFQQLQQTKVTSLGSGFNAYAQPQENREMDFALERGLCSLLVGELDDCRSWLGLDNENSPYRNASIIEFVLEHSRDDDDSDLPGLCKLLETWLMEVVFPRFRDTNGVWFRLGDYYDDPTVLRYLERLDGGNGSPLAAAAAIVRIGAEATAVLDHVKSSAILALKKVFPSSATLQEGSESSESLPPGENPDGDDSVNVVEISGSDSGSNEIREVALLTNSIKDASVKIMCAGVVIGVMTLVGLRFLPSRSSSIRKELGTIMVSDSIGSGMTIFAISKEL